MTVAVCGLLAGCVTHGPLIESGKAAVELVDTPFYPQSTYQCGPAALAIALEASGVAATPDALVPQVYLPGRRGSLQIEMQAAPRRYDRVSYELDPNLASITAELDAGRPVLVLHNYGLPVWPRWHYAVVIGYDPARQQVILRSGTTRREVQSAAHFMRAWDNAGRWAIVLLHPGELPMVADRARYLESTTGFERVATPASARQAFSAAIQAWPEDPIGWIGRGTANYRDHALSAAAADYQQAIKIDPNLPGARNNLAQTWLDLHCVSAARAELARIDESSLSAALRTAVADTRAQLAALPVRADAPQCAAL